MHFYPADGTRLGTVVTDCGAGQGPAARLPVCKLGLDCRDETRTGPAGCICGCEEARPVEGGYYGCGDRICSEAPQPGHHYPHLTPVWCGSAAGDGGWS